MVTYIVVLLIVLIAAFKWAQRFILSKMELENALLLKFLFSESNELKSEEKKYVDSILKGQQFIINNPRVISIWNVLSSFKSVKKDDKTKANAYTIKAENSLSPEIKLHYDNFLKYAVKYIRISFFINSPILLIRASFLSLFKKFQNAITTKKKKRSFELKKAKYYRYELNLIIEPNSRAKIANEFKSRHTKLETEMV